MSDNEITPSEYRDIKNLYEPEIEKLLQKKISMGKVDNNLIEYFTKATQIMRNLPEYYRTSTLDGKQRLICSIYPEKLTYENKTYRTQRINEVVTLMCNPDKAFSDIKKGQATENGSLSEQVNPLGLFSNLFIEDLKKLVEVCQLLASLDKI